MNWFQKSLVSVASKILARYEGAVFNPKRSVIPAAYTSARFDASASSRAELARKMRYFERNNPIVQALAGKFENFVVGSNPQVTPTSSDPEWNKKAKDWWEEWCQICDLSSRQNFGTILQLAARRWFIDGDIFINLTAGRPQRGLKPRIQLIESHLCRTPPDLERDPRIHDGVYMDKDGRPLSYYFAEEEKPGRYVWGEPTSADYVVPIFEPERPGEVRGFTHFHGCINELHDCDDLHMLEMDAARRNASTTDWIETASGELNPQGLKRSILDGTNSNSAGDAVNQRRLEYYKEVSGGRTRVLYQGDKIHQHAGERPSVVTTDYWKLKHGMVCACVEIPYCIVFPETMQGTVYRGALDMATAAFKSRHTIIGDAVQRIYGYVMNWARYSEPKLSDAPADFRKISILPPRAPNVDVGRNSAAMLAELASGATNFDLIYSPLGLSADTELRKLNAQLETIKSDMPTLFKLLCGSQGALALEDKPQPEPAPSFA